MSPIAAILVVAGTTGLVVYLATRRARAADAQFERPKSGE
jgi:hypothetical protein